MPFVIDGDLTERIRGDVNANRYLHGDAFTLAPNNQFGNAPRILPGVYSPWRNNVDLSLSKQTRPGGSTSLSLRVEILNLFNQVHWAGFTTAASQFGNPSFGQITNQANNMRMVQFTARFQF